VNILLKMTRLQFRMLLRNRGLILSSLGLAVISMLIFGTLFGNTSQRAISIGVADLDKTPTTAKFIAALKANQALVIDEGEQTALLDDLKRGNQDSVIVFEAGFEKSLAAGQSKVQFYVDQTDLANESRTKALVYSTFDSVNKQASGYKETLQIQEQGVTSKKLRQIDILTPGMLGLTIMFASLPVGVALLGWRARGTLKRLSATPLKPWQLIISQMISQLALCLAQTGIVIGLAITLFKVEIGSSQLPVLALLVLAGTFSLMGLGYILGSLIKKPESAQSAVLFVALPMMFLGGSYFVVEPNGILKVLVEILPLTHLNRAFRQVIINGADFSGVWIEFGILMATGAVLLALSIRLFRWNS